MTTRKTRLDDVDIDLHMNSAILESHSNGSAMASIAHSNLVIAELLLRTQEQDHAQSTH
jgi:hypothetical protein